MYTVTCVILSILMGLVVNSVLGNTIGYACLEHVFQFTIEYGTGNYCNRFSQDNAIQLLKPAGTVLCPQTCEVTIVGLQSYSNYLGTIFLGINGFYHMTVCSRRYTNRRTLIIDCSTWEKDKFSISNSELCEKRNAQCDSWQQMCVCYCNSTYLMVNGWCIEGDLMVGESCVSDIQCAGGGHISVCSNNVCTCPEGYATRDNRCYQEARCLWNEQCAESNKECVYGSCVCKDGYIMMKNNCIKGNLMLNQSCSLDEQCTGSPYATCLDGICTCIKGYTANNSADCVLRIQEYSQANSIVADKDVRSIHLGSILGALFGGLFLGVLVTTGVVFIFLQRFRSNTEKRDSPQVMYVENTAHNAAYVDINRDQETTNTTNVQRKVVNVPPYTKSVETPEYSNYSGNPRRQPAQEDVYNHLNENEDRDNDDNYDHASAAVGHLRDLNDYSSVGDVDKKIAAPDDYFTLEPN